MIQITKAQIKQATNGEQANKIIVVTYNSYLQKWYPFTLESFELIIADFDNIEIIQIIERGV